ncbi:MAG: hypothetical protein HY730_08960, partial [Candidatus Tectomicrobia bacterium]|nr:hypothetical protein [Candidatus Tectomicrobia bacterium]
AKPALKFSFQFAAGFLVYLAGVQIKVIFIPFGGAGLNLGWLSLPVTLLWVVGVTNAFNLIDGLDGLASGVACIAAMSIFGVAFLGQNIPVAMLAVILTGSLVGFLRYNFYPASIFLGDSGSLFLGFVLSIISIRGSQKETTVVALATPLLALGLPIIDTFLAMVRRFLKSVITLNREDQSSDRPGHYSGLSLRFFKMFLPDRDHIHHKVLKKGLSHKNTVLVLYGVALAFGSLAFFNVALKNAHSGLFLFTVILATLLGITKLGYREMQFLKTGAILPLFDNIRVDRRILSVFLDILLISLAYYLAFLLRFDGLFYGLIKTSFLKTLPFIILIKLTVFWLAGLYRESWRYMNIADLIRVSKALLFGSVCVFIFVHLVFPVEILSKAIYSIDFLLSYFLIAGVRSCYRILEYFKKSNTEEGRRALIYGAGLGGNLALREFILNQELHIRPVGFIDDDESKSGVIFNGFPVIGSSEQVDWILEKYDIAEIVVASSKIGRERIERLKDVCLKKGVAIKKFQMSVASI